MAILITLILTFIFSFGLITILGYVAHWIMHQPWAGRLYIAHRTHHEILYPTSDFYSDKYREAGIDDSGKMFVLLFSPFIFAILLLGWYGIIISPLVAVVVVIEMGIIGYAHDYLHEKMHLKKTAWQRFSWFRKCIDIHYLHHVDVSKNLGIFNFWVDRVMGTFVKSK